MVSWWGCIVGTSRWLCHGPPIGFHREPQVGRVSSDPTRNLRSEGCLWTQCVSLNGVVGFFIGGGFSGVRFQLGSQRPPWGIRSEFQIDRVSSDPTRQGVFGSNPTVRGTRFGALAFPRQTGEPCGLGNVSRKEADLLGRQS
jgi:hypothetical protein